MMGFFSARHRIQIGSVAQQLPVEWVTEAISQGVGSEADYSPPCFAEVKNAWSCNSTPPIRLHGVVLS
jgi:hypothetical protein